MEFVYKLFRYNYIYHVQGTKERGTEYALLYVPKDSTFNNNRNILYERRNQNYSHEINIESVEDLTTIF